MADDQKVTPAPSGAETVAQANARLGFTVDDTDDTVVVVFVGPKGAAAMQPKK